MLLGFNMLLWATHVEDRHLPIFAELKKTGYDGVEIPIFEGAPAHFAKLGEAARDAGLRVTTVTVIPDAARSCVSDDPATRETALDYLKWAIDCSVAAGSEALCGPFHQPLGVFTGEPPTAREIENVVAVHKRAAEHAATGGVRLAVEPLNRFECYIMTTAAEAAAVARAVGMPNYGYLYDTFHANIEEKDPVGAAAATAGAIAHVHVSENDRGTPGKGHVPWEATFRALKAAGYDKWFVIEAFGRALPALAAATKCWRDFSASQEEVYRDGHDNLRAAWARA